MQVKKKKNTNFLSRGGLQHDGCFTNLCFAKCEELSFGGAFLPVLLIFTKKNTVKIITFTHLFLKQTLQKNTF